MWMCNSLSKNTFRVRWDFFQFKTNRIPLIQTVVSLTLLYTISLTPKMLQAEIAAVLQCALLLNSHHRNTVALRRKQGVCVSSAPENRLIWCWKCGVIGKALAKTPPTPGVERGPLFCQEIILSIFSRQKISRHPPSLVTASARALSGCARRRSHYEPVPGPGCVWCAPSFFCWGIIKKRKWCWKNRVEKAGGRGLGPSKWMQLSITLSRWYVVCFPFFEMFVLNRFPIRI